MERTAFGVLSVLALCCAAARAESWHQWGGANRNHVVNESSGWTGSSWDITEVWERSDVGKSQSSPLIANVNGTWCVITMGYAGGTDYVRCINAQTGADVWVKSYSCDEYSPYDMGVDAAYYGGPMATPLYDAASGTLYTISVCGHLYYWDAHNGGTQLQYVDVRNTHGIDQKVDIHDNRDYGFTCSPLMVGNDIVLDVGDGDGTTKTLMAFDKTTAALSWSSAAGEARGSTNGPVLMSGNRLAVLSDDNLLIIDASTHATLASYAWNVQYGCDIATPAVNGDYVILTATYNQNKTVGVYVNGGTTSTAWTSLAAKCAVVCTPVVHGGYIYFADGRLFCLDASDGTEVWNESRSYGDEGTCLVTATDGKVVVWGGNKLDLFEAGATKALLGSVLNVLSSCEDPYPHVALGGGYYVVKDGMGHVACYAVGGGTPVTPPVVVNDPAQSVLSTQAYLCGQVTDDGGESPTVTIYYGTSDGGTTAGAWDESASCGTQAAGSFGINVTLLTPDTPYYYRAYATNSAGDDWADASGTFTTLLTDPDPPASDGSSGLSCVAVHGARLAVVAGMLSLAMAACAALVLKRNQGARDVS